MLVIPRPTVEATDEAEANLRPGEAGVKELLLGVCQGLHLR